MKEKRDFSLRRKGKPLTPEKLFKILSNTAGEDVAREKYKEMTGCEPPVNDKEENEKC